MLQPKGSSVDDEDFTEARESVSVLKFDGKLEHVNENDKDLDKEAFILTIELLVGEYDQQNFYFIENYHMVSVEDMIASYEARMISGRPESFDHFEKDDLIVTRSLVESHLSNALTAKLLI